MKVAIVQKDLKNLRSGVSRLVRSELEALKQRNHQAVLISERVRPVAFSGTNARVLRTFRWPFKGYFRRQFFKAQANFLLGRIGADVTVAHGDISDVDVCFIHNCVHLEHEIIQGRALPVENDVGRLHSEVLKAQRFKVLVCNSEIMRNDLIQRFDIRDKRIEVLYPSCDPQAVSNPSLDQRALMAIPESALVIGLITSGNFKKRNVQLFLEASSRLSLSQEVHVVVAGNGNQKEFSSALEKHPFKVHFLPSTDEVANYYAMLDLFVLPAHIEEFGMSALEAMTCGMPVVLHQMVGASEILEGESRRFVMSDLALPRWVEAIQVLCEDGELRKRVGMQNQATASKYTADEQNKQFMDILESVVSKES